MSYTSVKQSKRKSKRIDRFRELQNSDTNVREKTKMKSINYGIFYTILLLLAFGLIMVFSASSYYSLYTENDAYYFLTKELQWVSIGFIAMLITMGVDYHKYKKISLYLYLFTIILLIAVFFCGDINGAHRWIFVAGQSFQPSELAKYAIVFFLAYSFEKNEEELSNFIYGPIKYLAIAGIFALLIYKEPNMSIAVVIMMVTFTLLFIAKTKFVHLLSLATIGIIGIFYLMLQEGYRVSRWTSFLNPWQDPSGESFQLIQSLLALGSGGLFGKGLGSSTQKALYIPEPHNDFIFSIIGEELGFVGCFILILLFAFLIISGFKVAAKAKDKYGMFLAAGITLVIAVQAMINIAVVIGAMPVTGVPLPFISYGGSSLVVNLVAIGVLLNISRQPREIKTSN